MSWQQDPVNSDQVAMEVVSDRINGFVALGWSRDMAMVRPIFTHCFFSFIKDKLLCAREVLSPRKMNTYTIPFIPTQEKHCPGYRNLSTE